MQLTFPCITLSFDKIPSRLNRRWRRPAAGPGARFVDEHSEGKQESDSSAHAGDLTACITSEPARQAAGSDVNMLRAKLQLTHATCTSNRMLHHPGISLGTHASR